MMDHPSITPAGASDSREPALSAKRDEAGSAVSDSDLTAATAPLPLVENAETTDSTKEHNLEVSGLPDTDELSGLDPNGIIARHWFGMGVKNEHG